MKKLPFTLATLAILLSFSINRLYAQDTQTITVNSFNDDTGQLTKRAFKYQSFMDGKLIFKDEGIAEAKMNYNRLAGKVFFINPQGDTMILARPELTRMIIIGADTFYFYEKNILQRITHYRENNLALSQTIKFLGNEKKGAYGTYSGVSSSNSNTTFTNDDQITTYLQVDENAVYRFNNTYFLSDRFNNFFTASKKNFYKLFFTYEKEIKDYLSKHAVNFSNKRDLEGLLQYIHSL